MMRTLPARLAALRTAKGLTQSSVARSLGLSRSAVHYWESGARQPTLEQAARLAEVLGCTLDDLVKPSLSA